MLNTNYKLNKFHCATSTKAVLATQINFFFFAAFEIPVIASWGNMAS